MKRHNSLFTFLFLSLLCLGTHLSAQTGKGEDAIQNWVVIEGHFFHAFPDDAKSEMASMALVKGIEGARVLLVNLKEGVTLSDKDKAQAVPLKEVPNGEEILKLVEIQHNNRLTIVGTVNAPPPSPINIGEQIPEFSATDNKGQLWDNQTILGKPTVLNFWHTGCGPCIKEMPELNGWMQQVPDVNYLSVTWNTYEQIERIVTDTPFLFHHLADDKQLFKMFAVQITPTTILLDKQGNVSEIVTGTSETKRAQLLQRITELAKE